MNNVKLYFLAIVMGLFLYACSTPEGDFPGSEYMPDMGHSVAMEANTYNYYYYNTWNDRSTIPLYALVQPGLPPKGTVPRGYAAVYFQDTLGSAASDDMPMNAISVPFSGHVPYYYQDTEEERTRAAAEITANPFPITAAGLARGKNLYNIYCGICHGEKGDGLGYLVSDDNPNAKYPVVPANFLNETYAPASNGTFYHAIMYGKNVMGSYADKLGYEERWQVIHYIRSLQAKDQGLAYTENENTLNPAFGIPMAAAGPIAEQMSEEVPTPETAPEGDNVEGDGIENPEMQTPPAGDGEHQSDETGNTDHGSDDTNHN